MKTVVRLNDTGVLPQFSWYDGGNVKSPHLLVTGRGLTDREGSI